MKIRIHWKLAIVFSCLTAFILFALYVYLNSHLDSYLNTRICNQLKDQTLLAKDLIDNGVITKLKTPDADLFADMVGKRLNARVTILDRSGAVVGDSDIPRELLSRVENHIDRPEISQAAKKGFGKAVRFSTTIRKHMQYTAAPLGKDGRAGFVRLAMPLSDIELARSGPGKLLVPAILFAAISAVSLGLAASMMVSRPVREMSALARAYSLGKFSGRSAVSSQDELGELAGAMNHMAGMIKKEVDEVRSKEARLEAILMNMFEGVLLTDRKGEILLINPSIRKLFLIDTSGEGKTPLEVIRNAPVQDIVNRVLKEKRGLISEELYVSMPEEKVLKVNSVPVMKDGELEGAILVFHDITELRRLERMRQDFVANVSHELRTPISSIKGYAETLLDGAINDKAHVREFVDIIYRDSERLAKLIEDILDLSRIESGKMSMSLLPVDVMEAIKRSVHIMENQAGSRRMVIHVDAIPSPIMAMADETRLSQVMINLLDNAIKYSPDGGQVTVSASSSGGMVEVKVIDTGIGIPDEDIPRIFERFYRVDKAHSRDLGGTGLGLSIVKHIVQAHGGNVWVDSSLGHGSTFSFTIPAA